jgi:AcrR family transcriptional regulator
MPVERWTPARRRELTRNALLSAAAEVFARRGFEGASLEEIAEAAGFTRGAIYKNFRNKEDLFFAVSDRDYTARLQAFSERLDQRTGRFDPAELAALWRATVADIDDLALTMEMRLYAMRNPEVRQRFAEHQRAMREVLAEFIDDRVAGTGLTLSIPAATLAGLLDAASWGIVETNAIAGEDVDLLEAFFALVLEAACSPHSTSGEPHAASAHRAAPPSPVAP